MPQGARGRVTSISGPSGGRAIIIYPGTAEQLAPHPPSVKEAQNPNTSFSLCHRRAQLDWSARSVDSLFQQQAVVSDARGHGIVKAFHGLPCSGPRLDPFHRASPPAAPLIILFPPGVPLFCGVWTRSEVGVKPWGGHGGNGFSKVWGGATYI